ncbi:hypothetical protein [Stappia indica]|uniref:hypothetical protein n=1 Tax=Stappia indica TaxID=538381 RepID=UPI001CD6A98F|nr:hypothetical protein [Stappia indica]MCA1297996.1 hypothetical protein [Stappia indica]
MMEWTKKKKGCAEIYTAQGIEHAIVDRRGFGVAAALGGSVTFMEIPFDTVDDAKRYAESFPRATHDQYAQPSPRPRGGTGHD